MTVQEDIERVLRNFRSQDKVIGLTCIAPIIAAKVFGKDGVKLTLGGTTENFPYAGSIDVAKGFGAEHEEQDVSGTTIDWPNHLVTSPAYMQGDAKPHEVVDGISRFIKQVNELVKKRKREERLEEMERWR